MAALSHQNIHALFQKGDAAELPYEKGKVLEELIIYAFARIPGVSFYKANVTNAQHSEEVDVAFFNGRTKQGLPFMEFLLLVECKNWSHPVGAQVIREFATKLQERACAYGVLVAANGITGNAQDRTAAHDAIRMALALHQIRILVVTRAEIEAWQDSSDIVDLLKTRILELTVAGSMFL